MKIDRVNFIDGVFQPGAGPSMLTRSVGHLQATFELKDGGVYMRAGEDTVFVPMSNVSSVRLAKEEKAKK